MIILALDQALTNTGYAVIDLDNKRAFYGTISTHAKQESHHRIAWILAGVRKLCELYRPTIVFTEYVFCLGKQAAVALARVESCLHQLLLELNLPFHIVGSSNQYGESWWKAAGGRGTKEGFSYLLPSDLQVGSELGDMSHAADAIGIGIGGYNVNYSPTPRLHPNQFTYWQCTLQPPKQPAPSRTPTSKPTRTVRKSTGSGTGTKDKGKGKASRAKTPSTKTSSEAALPIRSSKRTSKTPKSTSSTSSKPSSPSGSKKSATSRSRKSQTK